MVDTSVWVAHFKATNDDLVYLLENDEVLCHPLVLAEIACGTPPGPREQTLKDLSLLQTIPVATMQEVLEFIEANKLYGRGCGYIDLALLGSVFLSKNQSLWTHDKRLNMLASEYGKAFGSGQFQSIPQVASRALCKCLYAHEIEISRHTTLLQSDILTNQFS